MRGNRSFAQRVIERVLHEPSRAFWKKIAIWGEANAIFRWIVIVIIGLLFAAIGVLSWAPELPR